MFEAVEVSFFISLPTFTPDGGLYNKESEGFEVIALGPYLFEIK